MKKFEKIDLGLKEAYEELFMNDEERIINRSPRVMDIEISQIDDFENHPFKVKDDEEMEKLMEEYPQRTIKVVDTLAASLGQGLYVWYACKKRDEGLSLDALYNWCEEHKFNISHWFTVDDLMYLKRGGRIGAATAVLGTMLNIKPVLHVDDEGHLVNVSKVRGRKAALDTLAKKLGEDGLPGENETVFISHGDCLADAEYVAKLCKEKYGVKNVIISYVGAVIGSHAGPGTVAFFFLGKHR